MAPLFSAPSLSLAASLLVVLAALPAASVSALADQISLSTVYKSSQSAAGFMFDVKTKQEPIVVFGLDANLIPSNLIRDGPAARVLVYTKQDGWNNFEQDESAWKLWMNTTIESYGLDGPTPIPQSPAEAEDSGVVKVPAKSKQAFYVAFEGPYLRYSEEEKWYYQDKNLVMYGSGAAKRKGWKGGNLTPRTFNGGLHYYVGRKNMPPLLPATFESKEPTESPIESPTLSPEISPSQAPTTSAVPTISFEPTISPTGRPTKRPSPRPTTKPSKKPTKNPTVEPTTSPIGVDLFSTKLEDKKTRPVLMYAGQMFDLKGRDNIEISTIGFNTYLTEELDVSLYIREGGYKGAENDLDQWEWKADVTVTGAGMGQATYLPRGSFEPIIVQKSKKMGFYLTTDGPYMRATKGDVEGKPHAANPDVVIYQGVGKRYPINDGTISPRIFNGVFGYVTVVIPTPSPTMDVEAQDLWVRNIILEPAHDTYIEKGNDDASLGSKAQLMVDGTPERVSLIKFDMSVLNGGKKREEPTQILSAKLRLYSMTQSEFGGYVSIIPDGDIDEDETTWENVPYGEQVTGTQVGEFRSIWPSKFYEMDITHAFRDAGNIPRKFLIRIGSDQPNGIMYRSSAGNSENGPRLLVKFAYEPDTNKALAKVFGSDPPTAAPTVKPEWEDAVEPRNPIRTYFNYNPRSSYGPNRWYRTTPDGYHDQFKKLKTDPWRNKCAEGKRQSPRDLCRTDAECLEFHETRPRAGQYGLAAKNETIARPTPSIMHNKLRLSYKERRSEAEEPIPPGADFARNGMNSGIQDIIHIDIKVRSEHRLCGKQYDAEMQLYYLHQYGNLEAISILIEADGEHNDHFQIMLDFFQNKFDGDARACGRRQRRARALLLDSARRNDVAGVEAAETQPSSKLRGMSIPSSTTSSMVEDDEELLFDELGQDLGDTLEADEDEEVTIEDEETSSEPSLSSVLYQRIHSRFLNLMQHRREKADKRWDPLKPWDIYKSCHFWSYSGSTTEPPCLEDVRWRVTDVPMKISPTQYIQLKRLMFDHVDPDSCRKTSSHYDESNARPVQPWRGGATYRCKRSDYASDVERAASGRVKGFVLEEKWWGVDNWPYVTPEFPDV